MGYKNPKELLADATKFPAAVEAMLPEGAPKISEMLAQATGDIPDLPDFVIEVPDLPKPPTMPGGLGRQTRGRGGVREVEEKRPALPKVPGVAARGTL